MIVVRYFGGARELAGCDREEIELPSEGVSTESFLGLLRDRHPRLAGYVDRMHLAVNGDFAPADVRISTGDEVDVLPPVAGGGPVFVVEIRDEDLSLDEAFAAVKHAGAGGVAIFVGVVRDHADGKSISRLDYEAHRSLAQKEMTRIVENVTQEFKGTKVAALHRTGQLAVGDIAVIVAVSAPHRADAFSACRLVIDRVKETVPIWKKEWDEAGNAIWVNLDA